jgi:hypothetical protein
LRIVDFLGTNGVPRFVVRVDYEWVTPCYREVEVDALDTNEAGKIAIALSESDSAFWTGSIECDGEASSTTVLAVSSSEQQ